MAELVVDTSVLVAIFKGEPEAERFSYLLMKTPWMLGWPNVLEARIWLHRNQLSRLDPLDVLLSDSLTSLVGFDGELERIAGDAYRAFGKGFHPAQLNYGDCMAYAVAKRHGLPLLFKGEDFSMTDVLVHPDSAVRA